MINEGQVTLLWQRLFTESTVNSECFDRAEELLDQLRSESPLRFRLAQELSEIRQMQSPAAPRKPPAKRKLSTR